MNSFSWHFPLHEFFFGFFPTSRPPPHHFSNGPSLTIDAASVTSLFSRLTDAVLALCSHSGKKADGIKQLKEELNFKFGDLFSNEGVQKTDIKLSILFTKLKELLEERNSQHVLIFDNVQELKLLFSDLNLEPGSSHFATFVVIITVQKRVSLERLSDYDNR